MKKDSTKKEDLIRSEGDKVYIDKLLAQLMAARRAVLKELAYR